MYVYIHMYIYIHVYIYMYIYMCVLKRSADVGTLPGHALLTWVGCARVTCPP